MAEVIVIEPTASSDIVMPKLRVCAYIRVSSDSDDQLNSYLTQIDYFTGHIKSHTDWEYADIYADEGITGTSMEKRDDFNRMMSDCRSGKIDKILTKSISRFARNTQEALTAIRELRTLGIEVVFEKENINTASLTSEMFIQLMSAAAQEESNSIARNMRMSYQRRMQTGEYNTSAPPYGYMLQNGELVIDKDQAQIVKRIFQEYMNGKSMTSIAIDLEEERIKKRNTKEDWSPGAVAFILANERYMGNAVLQKSYGTDVMPFKQKRNHGELDQYYLENSNIPIISSEIFNKAQKLRAQKRQKFEPRNLFEYKYMLRRKLVCGKCNKTFRSKRRSDGGVNWICVTKDNYPAKCNMELVKEEDICEAFIRLCFKLKKHTKEILVPIILQLDALEYACDSNNIKIDEINKQIAVLTEHNMMINRLNTKGYLDTAMYISQSNEISAKLSALHKQRMSLRSKQEFEQIKKNTNTIIELLDDYKGIELDKTLFLSIVDKIRIDGNQATFILINELQIQEVIRNI